jgi:hypothetical protein
MQQFILSMGYLSDATLNQDRSRDLFFISHCEAFKREVYLFIINTIGILIVI